MAPRSGADYKATADALRTLGYTDVIHLGSALNTTRTLAAAEVFSIVATLDAHVWRYAVERPLYMMDIPLMSNLPAHSSPRTQMISDLQALNPYPAALRQWLWNAVELLTNYPEVKALKKFIARLEPP